MVWHPQPLFLAGGAEVAGAAGGGVAAPALPVLGAPAVPPACARIPISGTSVVTAAASWRAPRGAYARSRAALVPWFWNPGRDAISLGGPPHWPRSGLAHLIGPVHGYRIA